jgi:hypothetical protein
MNSGLGNGCFGFKTEKTQPRLCPELSDQFAISCYSNGPNTPTRGEDVRVYANFSPPHVVPNLAMSVEPFQLGDFHVICWVIHYTGYVVHTLN